LQQILSLWNSFDTRRRIIIALATIGMFAAVLGLARMASTPSLSLLYSGLDPAAAGEVIAALEQRGVEHDVRGAAIYVDSARRDSLRMSLAGEGLPTSSTKGYELLDNLSGFGTTSQMFDAAYWRAKEGELARTIVAHPAISTARVHLASTGSNPFQRDVRKSASLSVTMTGQGLSAKHARALQHLVASAVAGLTPEDVAIIDAEGELVGAADETPGNAPDARAEALRLRANRLLQARVGPGNAVVEVALETVTQTETIHERSFDPESRVAISTESEERTDNSTGNAGGVTVASNLPEGEDGEGTPTKSNSNETRERVNYEVSTTEREVVQGPGATRRMTVAVLVNALPGTGAEGASPEQPRSEEELEALRELVAAAVGLDTERGDVLTLKTMPFEAVGPAGTLAADPGFLDNLALDVMAMVQALVLALVALVLGLFVLRPVLMRASGAPQLAAPRESEDANGPAAAALTGEVEDGEFDASGLSVVSDEDRSAQRGLVTADDRSEDPVARLRALIGERQEETVEILRSWLDGEEERT